jgi:hypothetical protein
MARKYTFDELTKLSEDQVLLSVPDDFGSQAHLSEQLKRDFAKFDEQGLNIMQRLATLNTICSYTQENKELFRLTNTAYPYWTDCQHHVLWIFEPNRYMIQQIKNIIELVGFKEYITWENPITKRSVPEIQHFQILVKSYEQN